MLVKKSEFPFFPTLVDDIFREFSTTNSTLPAVNIKEDENAFSVEVAVPGLAKEDIKINIENNVLTISSERKSENEEKKENYTRREYSYQSFKRSFKLPKDTVDTDNISASHVNGELTITIPKMEKVAPKAKMIAIE
ncbi:MAG: Hsp20/alpha crystallin family protein [Flavobacteriaceae bacterium]|nr:Hsp20/alpha crystallin family protein [Flavobacteriaceae bacterium]